MKTVKRAWQFGAFFCFLMATGLVLQNGRASDSLRLKYFSALTGSFQNKSNSDKNHRENNFDNSKNNF